MITRKAWVLYDNNGDSPFAVYQDRQDPELLEALKENPHAKVRGVSFQLSNFGIEPEPFPEKCPAIVYKELLHSEITDSFVPYLTRYSAVSKKTGLSFKDKSASWVIRKVEVSDRKVGK